MLDNLQYTQEELESAKTRLKNDKGFAIIMHHMIYSGMDDLLEIADDDYIISAIKAKRIIVDMIDELYQRKG